MAASELVEVKFTYTDVVMLDGRVLIEDRVTVPAVAFNHAGYRAWAKSAEYPDRVRTAFVDGQVLVEMTPESIEAHNKVKLAITVAVETFVREHDLGEVYPDGVLVSNESAKLSCEPDLTFVSWASFDNGRVRLAERTSREDYIEIVGSPDLVVEIVSDSSVHKDTRLLLEAYQHADVREYWIIDARAEIRFEILSNTGTQFESPADAREPQLSHVLGGRWTLARARNRGGRYTYRLARGA